jgi:hypothetical protein
MDITQALKDAENALRDFVAQVLPAQLGSDWLTKCGVSPDRIAKWEDRKQAEERRQTAGVVEERLIYYADFYDIKTILKKNWAGEFSTALGDWKTMEVFLGELEKLRDPDAHRRELLPHQKHLILGISGEIRNRLVRYRSKQETEEDYYPRIESVRDSLGNIWVPSAGVALKSIFTKNRLRPGDTLDFLVTASDPLGEEISFGVNVGGLGPLVWQSTNEFSVQIGEKHVGNHFEVAFYVKSGRQYHARGMWDDKVDFNYVVLPPKA